MVADIDILPRFNNKNGFIGNEMKIAMIAAIDDGDNDEDNDDDVQQKVSQKINRN